MPIPVLSTVSTVSSESAAPGGLGAPLSHHMFWSSSLIPQLLR